MRKLPHTIERKAYIPPRQHRKGGHFFVPRHKGVSLVPPTNNKGISIQTKLTIGKPNDPFEQQADQMAEHAISQIESARTPQLQAKCKACEEGPLQLKSHTSSASTQQADPHLSQQLASSRVGGNPLPTGLRSEMEAVFGADFTGVRMHTNREAIQMNDQLGARAFTHRSNVYFNQGEYAPNTREGKKLIAHELTHVLQQGNDMVIRRGPIDWLKRNLFYGAVTNNSSQDVTVWSSDDGDCSHLSTVPAGSSTGRGRDIDHIQDQSGNWYKIGNNRVTVHANGSITGYACEVEACGMDCD